MSGLVNIGTKDLWAVLTPGTIATGKITLYRHGFPVIGVKARHDHSLLFQRRVEHHKVQ